MTIFLVYYKEPQYLPRRIQTQNCFVHWHIYFPENLFYRNLVAQSTILLHQVSFTLNNIVISHLHLKNLYVVAHCVKRIQIWSFFWSVFSRNRTEYGEILCISPYSVWMRQNTDQKKIRIWTLFSQWGLHTWGILCLMRLPLYFLWTQYFVYQPFLPSVVRRVYFLNSRHCLSAWSFLHPLYILV